MSDFHVRYWGITGSYTKPFVPEEITEKGVRSICLLADQGILGELRKTPADADEIRELVRQHVPLALRTTFGGHTTCIEIRTPGELLIVDAGSGLCRLGLDLTRRWDEDPQQANRSGHLLITHAHVDHLFAIPFASAFYDARNSFSIWATRQVLSSLDTIMGREGELRKVYFPPTFESMPGIREFHEIKAEQSLEIGGTRVFTHGLNHPGGCLAFRLEHGKRAIVIATDHEQREVPDRALAEFARNADLLYVDAQYQVDEYLGKMPVANEPATSRQGWGHSTIHASIATGIAAGVERLHLGHHDPLRSDDQLAAIERLAVRLTREQLNQAGRAADACQTSMAYEGLVLEL